MSQHRRGRRRVCHVSQLGQLGSDTWQTRQHGLTRGSDVAAASALRTNNISTRGETWTNDNVTRGINILKKIYVSA